MSSHWKVGESIVVALLAGLFLGAAQPAEAQSPATRLSGEIIELGRKQGEAGAAGLSGAASSEGDEGREIARLDALPAVQIPIEDATLASAIKIVSQSAGMNFIAPSNEEFAERVSVSATINPWKLLQLLAERYRFTIRLQNGMWLFSRENAGALIAKTYQFEHANLDEVQSDTGSKSSFGSVKNGGAVNEGQMGQGFSLVYKIDSKKVVDDVRELIGLPPLASQSVVSTDGKLPEDKNVQRVSVEGTPVEHGQKVLYLPKTNALYVVCYRSQHDHVAEYIRQADQPPVQIRIEARFFATQSDPQSILGIDYSEAQPKLTLDDQNVVGSGSRINLQSVTDKRWPPQAILSSSALSVQLNALERDSKSEKIENPFVVTTSSHEALFSVGQEEPFLESSTLSPGAVDGGLGSTTNRISVKRIGTAVNVVPTYFRGAPGEKPKIRLVIKMELGRLTGFRQVTPQVLYPIVDSQRYEFTATVEEGQALAFGGLTGVSSSKDESRVPVLGHVPLLGGLFRHRRNQDQQRNLIGYIMPSIVHEVREVPKVELNGSHVKL